MAEKQKSNNFHSPDISKLKEVIIDSRTKIYIPIDADAQKAKEHYLGKAREKYKSIDI